MISQDEHSCVGCTGRKEQHTTWSFKTRVMLKAFIVPLQHWTSLSLHPSSSSLRCFCLKNCCDRTLNSRLLQRYFLMVGLKISCLMGVASVLLGTFFCVWGGTCRGTMKCPHQRFHSVMSSCMYYSVVSTFTLCRLNAVECNKSWVQE